MNTSWKVLAFGSVLMVSLSPARAEPIGTVFTYQGQLKYDGQPFNGVVDLDFTLWDDEVSGYLLYEYAAEGVLVEDGLFSALVDFDVAFDLFSASWIEVAVGFPAELGDYVTLSPRQRVTPAPYALALPNFRTFEDNVLGGTTQMADGVSGVAVTGGHGNVVTDDYGAIGGGAANQAGNQMGSTLDAAFATVGGGFSNAAAATYATVAGGKENRAGEPASTVGGGEHCIATGSWSAVPGGYANQAGASYSFAAGKEAVVREVDTGTFVWADASETQYTSTGPNQFLIRAAGGVGIGTNAPTTALSVIGKANFSTSVGIGTDTPTANLDLVSDSTLSTTMNFINTDSGQRYLLQVTGSDPGSPGREGHLELVGYGNSGVHHVLTVTPQGKFGVNTYAPTQDLSVGGGADFGGPVGIGTRTPSAQLDVVSSHHTSTAVNIKNTDSAQRFLVQVNGTDPGGDHRQGNLEIWGTGAEGNHNVFTATPEGNVGIGTSQPANALSVFGVADFSDRVGIGTSSPGYTVPSSKLEVAGGHIAVSNNYGLFSSNAAGDAIGAGFDTGADDTLDLYAGGGRKVRIKPNGRVGIGTDTPGSTLSVAGGADFSDLIRIGTTPLEYSLTNTGLEVGLGNITLGNGGGVVSVNAAESGIGAGFRTGTSGDLYLYANGTVRVHVAPDGKVGIGSSPPSERLTVGGVIRSTTGGFKFPDGSLLASADGATIWSTNGTSAYYNDGHIGIGTTTPQDKIDIRNGNITMDTGPSGSSALRFRYDGALRWTFLHRSWATNEFGLYNEAKGAWALAFTADTNRLGIGRQSPEYPLQVGDSTSNGNGAYLTTGGVWTNSSDRNAKEAFAQIDKQAILARVANLSVTSWRYKGEDEVIRHVGPMAQDFSEAFGLGDSDKHIGTIDADGIALAAIQGLHEQLAEKDKKIAAQQGQIAQLTARLERLEAVTAELAYQVHARAR